MNEKMRILKMIEEGKITASEASKLLQSMEDTASTNDARVPPEKPPAEIEAWGKKIAGVVAEAISGAADRVSDAFSAESETAREPGSQTPPAMQKRPAGNLVERQIDLLVEPGENELSLLTINGDVRVKGYNGDKISARLTYRAKFGKAAIDMVKLGGKYFLKYDADDFDMVAIDAFVPEKAFSTVKIDGANSSLDVSTLSARDITIQNANGSFYVSNISADTATLENMNGTAEAAEIDVAKLKLANYNNALTLVMSKFPRHTDYDWTVETGNAKLSVSLPTSPDFAYHIKAHAAMSEIRLGLANLDYITNTPAHVEAKSKNFDRAAKKVRLSVETSNAPLLIN